MLDIQFIRDNREQVATKAGQKGYPIDVNKLLELDEQRRDLVTQIEALRAKRNDLAGALKKTKPTPEQIAEGKQLKEQVAQMEKELAPIDEQYQMLLRAVPNMPLAEVPVGATEDENVVAKKVGKPTKFDFTPKEHWDILEPRDMLDKERAAKISGSRFAYLKGGLVRMQFAIVQFVMQTLGDEEVIKELVTENNLNLSTKPFTPVIPPAMLRTEPYVASARLNAEEVTYRAGQPEDDLWLNASAEHTLCTMYWNEILPQDQLPIRYIGYSTSFRREAGTYGKDTEGIIRMHQFDKLEMESFTKPEDGLNEHLLMVAIQEYILQQLNIPYRVLQKCTADIGKPNARGIDLEAWLPGNGRYLETHTADFMTDYQARRLQTRIKGADFVNTNDATALALGRGLVAIIENYQQADVKIRIPDVLKTYLRGQDTI